MRTEPILLGMFAHPDDESYGAGGTLARYAAEGVDVYTVIATDDDSGAGNDSAGDDRSLAERRAAETADAAAILGLAGFWILPYRDSGMQGSLDNQHPQAPIQQPLEALTQDLVGFIRRLCPQVVVTHL